MCLPLVAAAAAATTAVSVASSIASFIGTQSAHHAAVGAANLNFNEKTAQAGIENQQLSQNETETNLTDSVRQAQAFGQIVVSAGATGAGAYSSHQALSASVAGYNRSIGITQLNADEQRGNIQAGLTGASIQRSSEIAAAPKTNFGMLALDLAGDASKGVSTYAALGGRFGVKPAGGP